MVICAAIIISGSSGGIGGLNFKVVGSVRGQACEEYEMRGNQAAIKCTRAQCAVDAVVNPTSTTSIGSPVDSSAGGGDVLHDGR